MKQLSVFLGY